MTKKQIGNMDEKTSEDKLKELQNAKCLFPNCPEKPIIVSVPIKKKGLNLGVGVPLCITHMTYYQSGDIDFVIDKETLRIKEIKWSDRVA